MSPTLFLGSFFEGLHCCCCSIEVPIDLKAILEEDPSLGRIDPTGGRHVNVQHVGGD